MIPAYISQPVTLTPLALLRRLLAMLILSVVLSAIEIDGRRRLSEPTPIVLTLTVPPKPVLRAREYRPRRRRWL